MLMPSVTILGGTVCKISRQCLVNLDCMSSLSAVLGDFLAGSYPLKDLSEAGLDVDTALVDSAVTHEILPHGHEFRYNCPLCGRDLRRFQSMSLGR